jgi:hypothetical protein
MVSCPALRGNRTPPEHLPPLCTPDHLFAEAWKQTPFVHVDPAGQAREQVPQLLLSLSKFLHESGVVPQRLGEGAAHRQVVVAETVEVVAVSVGVVKMVSSGT